MPALRPEVVYAFLTIPVVSLEFGPLICEVETTMKISLEWLEEYLPDARGIGAERAAEALMNGGLPVESIERAGEDTVIDVEVTSNRADCLSHVGVARE